MLIIFAATLLDTPAGYTPLLLLLRLMLLLRRHARRHAEDDDWLPMP